MRQVPAGVEAEAHEGVARLHQRHERRLVGGRARVRLHVGEPALEERLGPLDRQHLGLVDELAAAVVAVAGIAFRVLVGEHGAGGLQHGARDEVLRRDQLDLVLLALQLAADDAGDLGIALGQGLRGEVCLLAPIGARRRQWTSALSRIGWYAGAARGPHITGLTGPTRRLRPQMSRGDGRWGYSGRYGSDLLRARRCRRCHRWRVCPVAPMQFPRRRERRQ